ncbi:MAG: hypothetical protein QOH39_3407 [Verrucomicrobiota bacterium]
MAKPVPNLTKSSASVAATGTSITEPSPNCEGIGRLRKTKTEFEKEVAVSLVVKNTLSRIARAQT